MPNPTESAGRVDLVAQVEEFLLDRQARGLSPLTLRWYRQQLDHLLAFDPPELTPTTLRRFLLEFGETHNPGGAHGAYRAVRAFLRWRLEEYATPDPSTRVPAPKVPAEIQPPVTLDTVKAMLSVCGRDRYGVRDRALLLCLVDSGLRRGEFLALDTADVTLPEGTIAVQRGKGGKARLAFVGAKTTLALSRYLRTVETGPLWVDRLGKRLTAEGLRAILRRRAREAEVPVPTPHMFRRAFALENLRQGMDLVSLQRLLGHSSLAIVQRYLDQLPEDLRDAHRKAGVVDNWE